MPEGIHDPRDIPVLTEAVDTEAVDTEAVDAVPAVEYSFDAKAVHAAVVSETLNLADSLLHQAAKDIEAALFEKVFDQLRAQLPELVDRVIRQQASDNPGEPIAVTVAVDHGGEP